MSPVPQENHLVRAATLKSYISTSQHFPTDFLLLKCFRRSCSNMKHAKLAVRIVSIWSRSRSWGQTQCTLSNLGFQTDCSDMCHQAMKAFALTAVYKHRHKGYSLHNIPFCCIFSCVLVYTAGTTSRCISLQASIFTNTSAWNFYNWLFVLTTEWEFVIEWPLFGLRTVYTWQL